MGTYIGFHDCSQISQKSANSELQGANQIAEIPKIPNNKKNKERLCPSNSRKFQLPKRYPSNTRTTLYAPSEAGNRPYIQRTGMTLDVFRRTR